MDSGDGAAFVYRDENRGYFMNAGGKSFGYIPALNTRKDHIDAIVDVLSEYTGMFA
jgi:ferrochelatase